MAKRRLGSLGPLFGWGRRRPQRTARASPAEAASPHVADVVLEELWCIGAKSQASLAAEGGQEQLPGLGARSPTKRPMASVAEAAAPSADGVLHQVPGRTPTKRPRASKAPVAEPRAADEAAAPTVGTSAPRDFAATVDELARWVSERGTLPRQLPRKEQLADPQQQRLARFLNQQQVAAASGALTGERLRRLLAVPGMEERAAHWERLAADRPGFEERARHSPAVHVWRFVSATSASEIPGAPATLQARLWRRAANRGVRA